jgi:murein DD-endopeptidase MepM/ murein hydrolase activator NlpD
MIVAPLSARLPERGPGAWLAPRDNGRRLHAGIDLAGPPGARVVAPVAGEVVLAGRDVDQPRIGGWKWNGYGPGLVMIKGADGYFHLLSHLGESPSVEVGDRVSVGAVVGVVSHLRHVHWEVRRSLVPPPGLAVVEVAIDPRAYLSGVETAYRPSMAAPSNPGGDLRTPSMFRSRGRAIEDERPTMPARPGGRAGGGSSSGSDSSRG